MALTPTEVVPSSKPKVAAANSSKTAAPSYPASGTLKNKKTGIVCAYNHPDIVNHLLSRKKNIEDYEVM